MQFSHILCAGFAAVVTFIVSGHSEDTRSSYLNSFAETTVAKTDKLSQNVFIIPMKGGRFPVEVWIGDMQISAELDSGATPVALTIEDARKLGPRLRLIGTKNTVKLASGTNMEVLEAMIPEIRIGPVIVQEVEAVVVPHGGSNLIGLSFLTRIKRFTIEKYTARLEQ
jgi:aspartyl protease family protein